MGDDGKRTLTPKLRFPEFRNAEGWITTPLGEEGDFLSSLTGKTAEHFGTGSAKFVTYMNVFTNTFTDMSSLGTVDVSDDEAQNTVEVGDVLFTVSSETPEEVGMSSVVLDTLPNCYVNSFCALFRFADGRRPNLRFLGYSLRQPLVRNHLATRAQGSTRFNLSKTAFRTLPLVLPSPPEQQKIADCLTSLDELIAAQGRKVEALKAHKKGLMQQLFPREGEPLPRLRFPEFRNDGQASYKQIGDFAEVTTGNKDTQNKVDGGKYPFFVRSQNVERIDSYSYDGEAVLTSGDGVGVGENYHYIKGKFDFHQRVYAIYNFDSDASGLFFFYYFSTHFKKRVKQMSAKNSVDSVRMSMIKEMPIWLPKIAEQQRIADCLSSLDARLTAEARKLDALKLHKRGLMQQLFPSPAE